MSLSIPVLTAAPPSNVTYAVNTAAGTIGVNWQPPFIDGSPVASYLVTLTYSYTTSGSGRGGGGAHTHTTTATMTVTGTTLKALFTGINFGGFPPRRTRFTISVVGIDPAGNHSATGSVSFTM